MSRIVPKLRLAKKRCFVTGGGSGIGRETCLELVRNGGRVMVADINYESAEETCSMIESETGESGLALPMKVDVSDSKSMKNGIDECVRYLGGLNVLFNNAGIMHSSDDNSQTTPDEIWDLTLSINTKGVFYGCKHGIPAIMNSSEKGSVINTASFVALRGAATSQLAYTASKGAVLAMTRELAVIHARDGIRFNSLCPGPIRTDLLMDFLDTEEKKQRRLVHVPMARFGEASEMAAAVVYLASDESSFMTGTEMIIDGGLCAAYVTP